MSNNAAHVHFLQKKKAEILARKEKEKMKEEKREVPPQIKEEPKIELPFANDGSFLERFKMMQKQQESLAKLPASPPLLPLASSKPNDCTTYVSGDNARANDKNILKVLPSKVQPDLKASAPIFKEEDEEADAYQPSDYDLAKSLAQNVAEGKESEAEARKTYESDSRYRFLYDPSAPAASYYQAQLKLFKRSSQTTARKRRWDDDQPSGGESSSLPQLSSLANTSSSSISTDPKTPPSAAPSSAAPVDAMAEFAKAKALIQAKAAVLKSGVQPVPPVISEEEKKRALAIEEQRMMNELYRKVIEQQAIFATKKRRDNEKPRYEYDSDEDTEGGTWEHKKRKMEMQKTEDWAGELTDKARGKHHLADFLPPEELEKFMENVKAVKEGRQADISDYAKFKIQADNVGFKLLQKAGWEEGTGLGSKRDGIVQPINKGKTSFDQVGVGAEQPLEVKRDDDDFELYRKRMMLAYKFRPNPLNNPRRPYY